ncbi:MAG: hypothetical protein IKN89_02945, partial [Oscillospiraceae bacterium]|nr:hypothetical protein [Oscillospiraceae bacterium]
MEKPLSAAGNSDGFFVMFAPGGASDAVRFALSDVLRFCRKVMGCVPRLTPAGTSRPQDTSRAFRSSRSAPAEHIVHKIT